ncbi:desulfoferrodoxin [Candidatus Falkowbacteria bacterium]|jgi:superoxide reductase|nr:desulfoferrodoxin [Candidatus Falkowbacteria bacterium]MBT4433333.1 desulfoferrodoxin [Candidatus Falkowbacteria bacterium]
MTKLNQVYKCEICGNIVEVLHTGAGELVCCGQPMKLQEEKESDEGQEKHLPVIEKIENKVLIKVGEVSHPMEETHYIEWIEVIEDGKIHRQYLKSNDNPKAEFKVKGKNIQVRSYCNIHGLWQV